MTTTIESLGTFETSWCPGCGNHDIMKALRQAIVGLGLEAHKVAHVSGIGQAAKAPHYIRLNGFNGLHGRSLPPAQAIRLCNSELTVIAQSGDGCNYGEGGNHFLAAIRRNVDMTLLVHDNQIYGLPKMPRCTTTTGGCWVLPGNLSRRTSTLPTVRCTATTSTRPNHSRNRPGHRRAHLKRWPNSNGSPPPIRRERRSGRARAPQRSRH